MAVERANLIDLPQQSLASRARGRSSVLARLKDGLIDVLVVLLVVLAVPLVILLLGLPLALVIRVIIEIAQRF